MTQLDTKKLGLRLMREWGLPALGWKLQFDNAKRRCGQCSYSTKTISLSRHFVRLNGEDEVRDTILHEIAHVLAGPGTNHGSKWKSWARKVGARPVRCADAAQVAMPEAKYMAVCDACGTVFRRHRLDRRLRAGTARCTCRRGSGLVWTAGRQMYQRRLDTEGVDTV